MLGIRIRWPRGGPAPIPASQAYAESAERVSVEPWTDSLVRVAIAVIVLLALAARVYNVNWDENTHLHPDERFLTTVTNDIQLPTSIGEYFDTDTSRLNPYNHPSGGSFVYGTLPVFLNKVVVSALGHDSYDRVVIDGRYLSAIFDAASVFIAFLIARRLYSAWAGLLAAGLLATAPLAIQHSHFYVVDPFLAFFTTLTLYYSVRILQEGRTSNYALAGAAMGLGMACKVTGILVVPVIVAAVMVQAWPAIRAWSEQRQLTPSLRAAMVLPARNLVLAGLLALLAFRVAQPYAFETPSLKNLPTLTVSLNQKWVHDQKSQADLLGGQAFFPPTIQWIHRASYLYPLEEMLKWGMGPAFGVAGWAGFAYAAYRLLRFSDRRQLLPVVFVAGFFGFMGREFSLYLRYYLPIYAVLAVLGGYALTDLIRLGSQAVLRYKRPALQPLAWGAVGAVMLLSSLAGLAYLSIYTRPVTRVEASRWMYATVPTGSSIGTENWDDLVPMQLPGSPPKRFNFIQFSIYDTDSSEKVGRLLQSIDQADYIVLSSNRLINSVPRNPLTYPVSIRYYQALQDGSLGFRLLRAFESYPEVLGVKFDDHMAEEALSSYDHPRVLIFEKTDDYSAANALELLGRGPFADGGLTPVAADHDGLLLTPADLESQQEGGTWNDVFSNGGIVRAAPVLVWLLALELAALAVVPLTMLLLRRLPDRGYLLAKPLGLLLVAYPVWLLTSLKLTHFTQSTVLLSLLAWLAVGGYLAYRNRDELRAFARQRWRLLLVCEAVFLVAFMFALELRLANPDLWHPFRGGEKPMDLAYLTAVARSTTLPPYDPWFAGGYINYYYFGQFLTATLIKLTTVPPEMAFNLAIPTFYAMMIGGAFSVSYNLASAARRLMPRGPGLRPVASWSPYVAAVLGIIFVGVAGNLDGVDQLSDRLSAASAWHVDLPVPLLPAVINGFGGLWQVVFHGATLQPFDFWRSSRMMAPTISITEFPYFTFLFADLHAHLMALPFELLTIGVLASLLMERQRGRGWQEWGVVALLGLIVGALRWINSWDYPTFVLLTLAVFLISERRIEGGPIAAGLRLTMKSLTFLALSFLLFKPFLDGYLSPAPGVHPPPETSVVRQYLAHFGVFAAIGLSWLLFMSWRALRTSTLVQLNRRLHSPLYTDDQSLRPSERLGLAMTAATLAGVALVCLWLYLSGRGFIAALFPVLAVVAWLALREWLQVRRGAELRLMVLAMLGLALALSIGVDLVTLDGDIQRMNTVFKFYLHIWVLLALASAFMAWQLLFVLWRPALSAGFPRRLPRVSVRLATGAIALLVMGALVYPVIATPQRLNDRFTDLPQTLDGMAYMRSTTYQDKDPIVLKSDYEGIQWLRHNVQGTPTIVEGRSDLYRWGSRFSIYTGLPAVLGWDWHQKQQRGSLGFMVDARMKDVDEFYRSTDVTAAQGFLRQYNVRYVIVGELERQYYGGPGLSKFAGGLNGMLELAYSNDDLAIYKVRSEALAAVSP